MKGRILKSVAAVVAILIYGQASYVAGFDNGADTSMCVLGSMMTKERHAACDDVWINSPAMIGTRLWRVISGDAVDDAQVVVTKAAGDEG